jgi:hypothetical protein
MEKSRTAEAPAKSCYRVTIIQLTLICILGVSACAPSMPSSLATPAIATTVPAPATLTAAAMQTNSLAVNLPPTLSVPLIPTPGLILRGRVHLQDGSGLAGVTICRNFASYPGIVAAVTGADGAFQSDFAFIPGDEMVGVWPLSAGYQFEPPFARWRHYYSLEDQVLDFVASPAPPTAVPPGSCS